MTSKRTAPLLDGYWSVPQTKKYLNLKSDVTVCRMIRRKQLKAKKLLGRWQVVPSSVKEVEVGKG